MKLKYFTKDGREVPEYQVHKITKITLAFGNSKYNFYQTDFNSRCSDGTKSPSYYYYCKVQNLYGIEMDNWPRNTENADELNNIYKSYLNKGYRVVSKEVYYERFTGYCGNTEIVIAKEA